MVLDEPTISVLGKVSHDWSGLLAAGLRRCLDCRIPEYTEMKNGPTSSATSEFFGCSHPLLGAARANGRIFCENGKVGAEIVVLLKVVEGSA
jgi:hypothetical protein